MSRKPRGDTIVEVLLAIGIAAFGIGTTYATAQRGLDQTITAREHNQALNLIQNQITELQLRYQSDPTGFESSYGYPLTNFCLDDTTTYQNTGTTPLSSPSPYKAQCAPQKAGDGVQYFINIVTTQLASLTGKPTLFQIFVRWEPTGGGPTNQASTYFRENGPTGPTFGYTLPDSLAKLYTYRGAPNAS
jgi:type II secretory pathway pseudopilin PulG